MATLGIGESAAAVAASSAAAAGSGAAATGSAAAGTAAITSFANTAAVASTASTASTLGTIASYASIASALAGAGLTVLGANRNAANQNMQADQQRIAAEQELLRGRVQQLNLRSQLARTLASQNARYAAAGLTLEGTPETVAAETTRQAEREFTTVDINATTKAIQDQRQARLLDDSADYTRDIGYATAGVNLLTAADRAYARTPGTIR